MVEGVVRTYTWEFKIIDVEKDSLRYHFLWKNYQEKVEHVGAKPAYEVKGVLIL